MFQKQKAKEMVLIKERETEIPVIDFGELDGENRSKTMSLLDHACDKWGFFMVCILSLCC